MWNPAPADLLRLEQKMSIINEKKVEFLDALFLSKYNIVDYDLITTNPAVRAAEKLALSNKHNNNDSKPYQPE